MITLIGASGFVGTRLLDILKKDFPVKNLDKNPSAFHSEITVIGDVRNSSDLDRELKGQEAVILLAAEHRDDVTPSSLYYDVNVQGARNVLEAMDKNEIRNIFFFSSLAIYGLNKINPDENHPADPFNHYGKSKWQAEEILREWYEKDPEKRTLTIIRPTVIFGERNRGNVYNLLKQISSNRFMMVGKGTNKKSMAYVGNVVHFVKFCMESKNPGYRLYNYVDQPDMTMNDLIKQVETSLNKKHSNTRFPYWMGYSGGLAFDIIAFITRKKLSISSVRIKKFCATTQADASKVLSSGFHAPYTLSEGLHRTLQYEFVERKDNEITFESE